MKLYEISLAADALTLSDAELASTVRERLTREIERTAQAVADGRASVRKKLGTPITINGVTYDSRAQARQALGLSFQAFAKRYPT